VGTSAFYISIISLNLYKTSGPLIPMQTVIPGVCEDCVLTFLRTKGISLALDGIWGHVSVINCRIIIQNQIITKAKFILFYLLMYRKGERRTRVKSSRNNVNWVLQHKSLFYLFFLWEKKIYGKK